MTTTQRTRPRPSLDLRAILAAAPAEPQPRTLAEIHAEVGGFPFTVRKVASTGVPDANNETVGTEITIDMYSPELRLWGCDRPPPPGYTKVALEDTRSWVLLGHR